MAKFCYNCGKELKETDIYCVNCGKKVKDAITEEVNSTQASVPSQAKSKVLAGVLGLFLGCFGVHNFYLGYTGKGIAQLLLTLLSCFIFLPVTGIWALIESIMILTGSIRKDAYGVDLVD